MISFSPLVIGFKTTMTLSRSFLNGALAIAGTTAVFGFGAVAQAAADIPLNFGFTPFGPSPTAVPSGSPLNTATAFNLTNPNLINVENSDPLSLIAITDVVTITPTALNLSALTNSFAPFAGNGLLTFPSSGRFVFNANLALKDPGATASTLGVSFAGTLVDTLSLLAPTPAVLDFSINRTAIASGGFSYNYSANFISPETPTIATPEPSAVLGMLALGLTGVLARRQKG